MNTLFYNNSIKIKIDGNIIETPDPFIIKDNGYYYLTFTYKTGIMLLKSFDLIKWKPVNTLDGLVANDSALKFGYAPEIIYFNGYYYLVTSPSGNGHYFFRSKNIEGPFKRISENIHELIDGSFFIDSDFEPYFLRATETGIIARKFKNFADLKDLSVNTENFYFKNSSIGPWTEGPYLFKRYNNYYLTYCGTHFLSGAYRVDYCSGNKLNANLEFKDTCLINLDPTFKGLGHSMNFVGPDLDGYYICYHNLNDDQTRNLNFTKLLFSNDGRMLSNGAKFKNNPEIKRPIHEIFAKESSYLTKNAFDIKHCSIEYNFKGSLVELIYEYKNETNYSFIELHENSITFYKKINGEISKNLAVPLNFSLDLNVYHSLRVQFLNDKVNIYLDNIEIVCNKVIHFFKKSRVGFINNKLKNAYFAVSNETFGSSDQNILKCGEFFTENMVETPDGLETEIYLEEDGDYIVELEKFNNNTQILIDDKKVRRTKNICKNIRVLQGFHKICIKNAELNSKISIHLDTHEDFDMNQKAFIENSIAYPYYISSKDNAIYFENDRTAMLTKGNYQNFEMSVDMELVGNPTFVDRFAGLICNVTNYADKNEFEGAYSLQGLMFVKNLKGIYIIDCNFYHYKILQTFKHNKANVNLKVIKSDKNVEFYIDGKFVYTLNKENISLFGRNGIYMNHASAMFKNIKIKRRN